MTGRAEILNARLGSEAPAISREFQTADPFRHAVIPDFFSGEFAGRLLADFPKFDARLATGEYSEVGKKAARRDVRGIFDSYRELDDFIQTKAFLDFVSEVSGISGLMYDREYHGGGTHENLHGASLYPHVDFNYHPKGWHRRLNLIVYLSPEWQDDWGGNLEFHSNPWNPDADKIKKLRTTFNQAVLFETTETSWHGFRAVRLPPERRNLSRKSFAIYLYTKDRPAEETAASHNTVYVPFELPEEIRPGVAMTPQQFTLMKVRFAEYRNMLKLQYDRQLRMSADFAAVYKLDLQGYAIQTKAPTGRWPDGWVSSDFTMEFLATRPVRELAIVAKVAPHLTTEQVFTIQVGDSTITEVGQPGEDRRLTIPMNASAGETVQVRVHASTTSLPPGGHDTRELAWLLVSATLEH